MIDRYARPEMRHIWSLENQYQSWLDVEIAVTAGWVAEGHVPEADLAAIRANARFDAARLGHVGGYGEFDIGGNVSSVDYFYG